MALAELGSTGGTWGVLGSVPEQKCGANRNTRPGIVKTAPKRGQQGLLAQAWACV